jgi:hypothetical protein
MRRRWVQQADGTLSEITQEPAVSRGTMFMPDIEPYQAMFIDKATGSAPVVTSRSQHRELLRRNGLQEIGNEIKAHMDGLKRPIPRDPKLKARLIEVAQKHRFYQD